VGRRVVGVALLEVEESQAAEGTCSDEVTMTSSSSSFSLPGTDLKHPIVVTEFFLRISSENKYLCHFIVDHVLTALDISLLAIEIQKVGSYGLGQYTILSVSLLHFVPVSIPSHLTYLYSYRCTAHITLVRRHEGWINQQ
jgi:hypothetical protein